MTPEEWAAAAASAKAAYEGETRDLVSQLERARAKIARLEKRLSAIDDLYRSKIAHLGAQLLGLSSEDPSPPPIATPTPARRVVPAERKRGTLDEPVFTLIQELRTPDVASREVVDAWNQRHQDKQISDSTVRSILDRLEGKGRLEISQKGGGKGSGIPTRYRPV